MSQLKIAIAGASGFVGKHLIRELKSQYHCIALSRSKVQTEQVEWRATDLFSAGNTLESLKGVDIAIYLVHSMLPSSRLFQGSFEDVDLLLADNFARACQTHKVKQIIYLGGLVPESQISKHLKSRQEVEEVFLSTHIPTTILRAGMIVGQGGGSFEILYNLVKNIPVMILPKWTTTNTQAIYIDDLISILIKSIVNPDFYDQVIDVVNGEKLNYQTLLKEMAQALHKKRLFLSAPINSTSFSKLWVTLFGKSQYSLVAPLIDSLRCDLTNVGPSDLIKENIQYPAFENMLQATLNKEQENFITPRVKRKNYKKYQGNTVRSIQRLPSISHKDAQWISQEYMRWLPLFMRRLIYIEQNGSLLHFKTQLNKRPLLSLQYISGSFEEDRNKFFIIGGLLCKRNDTGWLEFRQIGNKKFTLAAIHEFIPTLPWYIYIFTQAPMHKWVMHEFSNHLQKPSIQCSPPGK